MKNRHNKSNQDNVTSWSAGCEITIRQGQAYTFLKLVGRQKMHQLRENSSSGSRPIVSQNQTEPESQKRPFAFQIEKS
jgi:hypothetical protein